MNLTVSGGGWGEKLESFEMDTMHTAIFKMGNKQGPTV